MTYRIIKIPDSPVLKLSATEAMRQMRSGTLTATDYASAYATQIELNDSEVMAWSHFDRSNVLAQATALDTTNHRGPLHGIPIGIKDILLTSDCPTQYNSPMYEGFHPAIDAAAVATLRNAGALIFGKTETVEFASTGRKARTRNPHDLSRTPGASSSGSAAAVADFHVPIAIGTQTGGSIIRPAAYCGVYGMKPTWNIVSTEGAKKSSTTLDTIGWFARSVDDLKLVYDVFDRGESSDETFNIANLRIGVYRTSRWADAETAAQTTLNQSVHLLHAAGANIFDLELPPAFAAMFDAHRLIMRAEAASAFLAEHRSHPALLHESIAAQVENHDRITRKQLCGAYDLAASCRAIFDAIAAEYDAVITLSAVGEAPVGLAFTGEFTFNGIWTLLHVPCVHMPCSTGPNKMPLGITITGPRFSDTKILAVANAVSRIIDLHEEHDPS